MNGREKAGEDADRRRNEAAAGEGDEVQKTQYTSNQTPQIFHPGVKSFSNKITQNHLSSLDGTLLQTSFPSLLFSCPP